MNGTYTQRRRTQMAGGGITNARQGYFLGDLVRKIKDDIIPNELKESPVGAALLGGALVNQFGIPGIPGDVGEAFGQNWLGELLGNVPGVQGGTVDMVLGGGGGGQSIMDIFRPETISTNPVGGLDQLAKDIIRSQGGDYFQDLYGITGVIDYDPDADYTLGDPEIAEGATGTLKNFLTKQIQQEAMKRLTGTTAGTKAGTTGADMTTGTGQDIRWKTPLAIGLAAGAAQKAMSEGDVLPQDTTGLDLAGIRAAALQGPEAAKAAGLHFLPPASATTAYAQGGRIRAQEGGLMNLGGMEKDYRQEGGFVPIGAKEKADDVPARLSKNEFVFTAEAVRNAGGGDIDEGAAVMERLMENLEAGGKVSEDSQGLEGAQEMFANTQRLQNRII